MKSGLSVKEGVLPGPIKLHSKAATVFARAQDEIRERSRDRLVSALRWLLRRKTPAVTW